VQIWDTAGAVRFRAITTAHYRGKHGVLVVVDLSERNAVDGIRDWLQQV
jgi:Ras-related protein Rab-1A